jgi:hypothetical protein
MNTLGGMWVSVTHRDLPTTPTHVRTHASSLCHRHIVRLTLNTFFLSLLLFTSIVNFGILWALSHFA